GTWSGAGVSPKPATVRGSGSWRRQAADLRQFVGPGLSVTLEALAEGLGVPVAGASATAPARRAFQVSSRRAGYGWLWISAFNASSCTACCALIAASASFQ